MAKLQDKFFNRTIEGELTDLSAKDAEEIGKVVSGGTKLYKHHIQFENEDYIELFNTTNEPIISGTFNADNVTIVQTAITNAISTIINLGNAGTYAMYCRPLDIQLDFQNTKTIVYAVGWNEDPSNPQIAKDSVEVVEAFDTVTPL